MKSDLIRLISQIDNFHSLFKTVGGNGIPRVKKICDNSYFIEWKEEISFELQELYKKTENNFIKSTLDLLLDGFTGWNDEKSFAELKGKLNVINDRIDIIYDDSTEKSNSVIQSKKTKIFISHSSKDVQYVKLIVDFLEGIGIRTNDLFCSSIPGYDIPINQDIYDYLRMQFNEYNLHVIFVLSKNYYQSAACLNEMGAAWVLKSKYTVFLIPGFEFKEIQGAINPRIKGIKFDDNKEMMYSELSQLKDNIVEEFNLPVVSEPHFLRKILAFDKLCKDITTSINSPNNKYASILLRKIDSTLALHATATRLNNEVDCDEENLRGILQKYIDSCLDVYYYYNQNTIIFKSISVHIENVASLLQNLSDHIHQLSGNDTSLDISQTFNRIHDELMLVKGILVNT